METREYYIYQQIPSGGISYDTTECFKKDLSILPCNSVYYYKEDSNEYFYIGVTSKYTIPKMIYFNGIGKGLDCPCCGDRWDKIDTSDKRKIFIFENKKEFEEALKNKELERYNHYTILEDFKGWING